MTDRAFDYCPALHDAALAGPNMQGKIGLANKYDPPLFL
jgi:hypothetical protein